MPPPPTADLHAFIDDQSLGNLLARAHLEDMGTPPMDVTSQTLIEPNRTCLAYMRARQPGVLAGAAILPAAVAEYDPGIEIETRKTDGQSIGPGQSICSLVGPLRSILALERTALNLLTHLCGIATLTAQYVEQTRGTRVSIYDTRKTLPGLRGLQKYAVACGGGHPHRLGLYDAVLAKDNHLAHIPTEQLAEVVSLAATQARQANPELRFVEVEVDTLEQLKRILNTPIDIVLLDNMNTDQLSEAVKQRDALAPAIALEASGAVNLETTRAIARTGVDRIAVGALTHSAPALDIGLDVESG